MNYLKKLTAIALALVMVLALSPTASAAGTGSITVANPLKDQTYTAYKIFDAVYNNDKSSYSYTIDKDSKWFSVVAAKGADGTVTSKITGLTFQKLYSNDPAKTTYAVKKEAGFSAAGFAGKLKEAIEADSNLKSSGDELTLSGNPQTASIDNLELGYYFVTSTSGALCNLITTNPDVTIHDKNDVPFGKTDDAEDVEVGQTVKYTITGKVPDTTGFDKYIYEISDTMSEGLTFQKNVKVEIDGTEVPEGDDTYTVKYNVTPDGGTNPDPNSFKVSINVMAQQNEVGEEIKVTYSAVVNEKAVGEVSNNRAVLKYSNDPTDGNITKESPPDKETVYSAKIVIDKYAANASDEADESKKLEGAKFVLYKKEVATPGSTETLKYYKYTEAANATESDKVEWVTDIEGASQMTTDEYGAAEFIGLKDGTYYLEEITAPTGYNPLARPVDVEIDGSTQGTGNNITKKLVYNVSIANNAGAELPSTGGIGTTIFYVVGSILLVGAAVLLVTKKRMGTEE